MKVENSTTWSKSCNRDDRFHKQETPFLMPAMQDGIWKEGRQTCLMNNQLHWYRVDKIILAIAICYDYDKHIETSFGFMTRTVIGINMSKNVAFYRPNICLLFL